MNNAEFEKCFDTKISSYWEEVIWLIKHGFSIEDSDFEGMGTYEGDVTVDGAVFVVKTVSWDGMWTVTFSWKEGKTVKFFQFGENDYLDDESVVHALQVGVEAIHNKLNNSQQIKQKEVK